MGRAAADRRQAKERGSHRARLQHPVVDLTNCIGCGLCVAACPEEGVLDLLHGQAIVVHGARCVGHGRCAEVCPTAGLAVTLGDLSDRRDIPAIDSNLEVRNSPGLYLAGEVTGYALVRTAISHGVAVADEVAARRTTMRSGPPGNLDLLVVGAGPAGIACALQAKKAGLDFVVLEQEELGGTVAKYPRRKLVMTQPVDLPLYGRLARTSYEKEELTDLWTELVRRYEIPVRTGVAFTGLDREADCYRVPTPDGEIRARSVCIAIGRRGRPRKLGVPGEELPKVAYHLVDAQSWRDCRILVVGGGDSAVEAALGLAAQPGNEVTLSYRRAAFTRIKARNEVRLEEARAKDQLRVATESRVLEIGPEHARLAVATGEGETEQEIGNDAVFVMAGGVPPFELLERAGVSFDPADREQLEPLVARGSGLPAALGVALSLTILVFLFAWLRADYYTLPLWARPGSPHHAILRPSGPVGLSLGLLATGLMAFNLVYLLRRSRLGGRLPGSLRSWMTAHMVTGVIALPTVLLHAGFAPRDSSGGHALIAMTVVVAAGGVGRYLYSFLPRKANGSVLALEEVRARLASISGEWDRTDRGFGDRVRQEIGALTHAEPWQRSLPRRLLALLTGQRRLRKSLARIRDLGRVEDVAPEQVAELLALARRAHRISLMAGHYEDLRGLMASWRYLHRWLALLLVLLLVLHVVTALRYAELVLPGGGP